MTKKYNYKQKENGKKDTGRPTKYKPEYCDEIIKYFLNVYHTLDEHKHIKFINDFAFSIGVHDNSLENWGKSYPEFLCSYKKTKEIIRDTLCQAALRGYCNPTAFIFISKNITDMRDKQEVEHSGEITERVIELSKMNPKQLKAYLDKLEKEI